MVFISTRTLSSVPASRESEGRFDRELNDDELQRLLESSREHEPEPNEDAVLPEFASSPRTINDLRLRILVPGGQAVFAVWGPRDRNPWLGRLFDAITARLGIPLPPPGMPGPFSLSDYGKLEELLGAAGFRDVSVREVATPMTASSFGEWWSVVPSLAGPVGPLLAAQPVDVGEAIRSNAETALDEFRTETGYELPGLSFVGAGRH